MIYTWSPLAAINFKLMPASVHATMKNTPDKSPVDVIYLYPDHACLRQIKAGENDTGKRIRVDLKFQLFFRHDLF